MKKAVVAMLVITASLGTVSADVTKEALDKAVKPALLGHPYLYFGDGDKPAILRRVQEDPDFAAVMERTLAEANRYMYTPVEIMAPPRQPNPRFEVKYEYENYLTDYTKAAYTLAFVYQMTGDVKYAEKAFQFIDGVCEQPTWVHMACEFNTIYDRVVPWGAKDDQVVFSYMQWTDSLVFKIAAVYDWLYPAMDKRQRDRIRGALLEKAILRVRGNYEYLWWTTAYLCNWCAVLNGSLGVAAAALLTEDPQLTDVIAESYNRVGMVLDEIHDGGWQEGTGYLAYAIQESMKLGDVLKRITGGTINLYAEKLPRFDAAVATFLYSQIPPGMSVPFSDGGGHTPGSFGLYTALMAETGSKHAAWLRKNLFDDKPSDLEDLFSPKTSLEPELPSVSSIHFPGVEWVIMRSDFSDPEKMVIAAKSGMNDDPHHGHLDQGHISLFWCGTEYLCDNNTRGYDRTYFDKERWDYVAASTAGHNTVMVNGEQQFCAKLKDQPWKEGVGGKVVVFKQGGKRDYALLDPTNAYPKKELKGWRRHLILEKPDVAVIVDEVSCAPGAEIEARFHSAAEQTIYEKYVLLSGEKGKMALIPLSDSGLSLRSGRHASLPAQRNAEFRWIPYFGTIVRAEKDKTLLGAVILPVEDNGEASLIADSVNKTIDRDGSFTVSFMKHGEVYRYTFKKTTGRLEYAE